MAISSEESVDALENYPFPFFDEEVVRSVTFASNKVEGMPNEISERELLPLFKKILKNVGQFHLSLYSTDRWNVKLVIWFT